MFSQILDQVQVMFSAFPIIQMGKRPLEIVKVKVSDDLTIQYNKYEKVKTTIFVGLAVILGSALYFVIRR